jgi:hypothetical protein
MTVKKSVPVAQAIPIPNSIPVASAALESSPSYILALPVGCHDLGFQVQGSPPFVSQVHATSPVFGQLQEGHYIHALAMPDTEIVNLVEPTHLMALLTANVANPRDLLVSSGAFYVDSSTGTTVRGVLYKHRLPTAPALGVTMEGFPPVIINVMPHSPLQGRLHPGQTVEALIIPGQPVFNLAAGAFTSTKVQEKLLATSHLEGRQLVVKDGFNPQREKGSSRAFDDCVIL